MSNETRDALTPAVITDVGAGRAVPEHVQQLVDEGKRAGVAPVREPATSSDVAPRAHLPQYAGRMRGELPANHPAVQRRQAQVREARRREKERDLAVLAAEAAVEQKLQLGSKVVIGSNAKVDYEDDNGARVRGNYAGIEGEVYQTYLDTEGVRRYIVIDKDPATGKSRYAPVAVRECDLTETADRAAGGRRFHPVGVSPERRAELAAQARARQAQRAHMTQEEQERLAFGGRTAEELASLMCGGL